MGWSGGATFEFGVMGSDSGLIDEELFISGPTLVHSRGNRLVRALSFEPHYGNIKSALWTRIKLNASEGPSEDDFRTLCVLLEKAIRVYCEGGESQTVPLPFMPRRAWSLGKHLLIQSHPDLYQVSPRPRYYTLTHPLEGVKPLTEEDGPFDRTLPPSEEGLLSGGVYEIIHVSQPEFRLPLLVVFNKRRLKHSIWRWDFIKRSPAFKRPRSPVSRSVREQPPPETKLSFEMVWEEQLESTCATHGFFLNPQREDLLCLVVKGCRLSCFRFSGTSKRSEAIFSAEALDAIPVSSFQAGVQEALFLSPKGELCLWAGQDLEPILVHPDATQMFTALDHPCGVRFSAKGSVDHSWHRFSFEWVVDRLVLDCLDVISLTLPKQSLFALRGRMSMSALTQDWRRFATCLLSLVVDAAPDVRSPPSVAQADSLLAMQYSHLVGEVEAREDEIHRCLHEASILAAPDEGAREALPEMVQNLHLLLQEYLVLELHKQECLRLSQLLGVLTQVNGGDSFNHYYRTYFGFVPQANATALVANLALSRTLPTPFCIFRQLSSGEPFSPVELVQGATEPYKRPIPTLFPGLITLSKHRGLALERFIPAIQIYLRSFQQNPEREELGPEAPGKRLRCEASGSTSYHLNASGRVVDGNYYCEKGLDQLWESTQARRFTDHRLAEVQELLGPSAAETFTFSFLDEPSLDVKRELLLRHELFLESIVSARMLGASLLKFRTVASIVIKPTAWAHFTGRAILNGLDSEVMEYSVGEGSPAFTLFHQGVYTALQLSSDAPSCVLPAAGADAPQLGGYIFGLGLQGRLREVSNTELYAVMAPNDVYVVSGVLLGLAASNFASHNLNVGALLTLHLSSGRPQRLTLKNMSALLSLALVNFSSADTHLVQYAIQHLRAPQASSDVKEEVALSTATALTAGLALGLLGFGRGQEVGLSAVNPLRSLMKARADYATQIALAMIFFNTNDLDALRLLQECQPSPLGSPLSQMVNHICRFLVRWDHGSLLTLAPPHWDASHFGAKLAAEAFALGLFYRGTYHSEALGRIVSISDHFLGLVRSTDDPFRRSVLDSFLTTTHLAMALVMAGSADLGVLQRLRHFQRRREASVDYGHLCANSIALGLLVAGEGRFCLSRERDESLALMLLSLFPIFPHSPEEDLAPFPQIFRYFWALALVKKPPLSPQLIQPTLGDHRDPSGPVGLQSVLRLSSPSACSDLSFPNLGNFPQTCFTSRQLVPQRNRPPAMMDPIRLATFSMLFRRIGSFEGLLPSLRLRLGEAHNYLELYFESILDELQPPSKSFLMGLDATTRLFLAFQLLPSLLCLRRQLARPHLARSEGRGPALSQTVLLKAWLKASEQAFPRLALACPLT
ncbi:Anaphase-promoting complex subunit 1 [Massospora cicadina]|nr:Anaphase-promoting complex subunit 1 [Massospora cicadina]